MNRLGPSGSTILSDSKKFTELFEYNLEHIEIGEFKNKRQFRKFIKMLEHSLVTFSIQSPIIRGGSKYDIIENNGYTQEQAIEQIESEAKLCKYLGAKYILVHFPFFAGECEGNANEIIEDGLKRLSQIQKKYDIPIVCEPKLGKDESPMGIEYLNNFPVDIWSKYDLKICIDIGDYVMAVSDEKTLEYIAKWKDFIHTVHLHNVDYPGCMDEQLRSNDQSGCMDEQLRSNDQPGCMDEQLRSNDQPGCTYFWKPMHPDDEHDGHHKIQPIVEYLAELDNLYFILEHTPHMGYSMDYVREGVEWVKGMVD